MTSTDERSGGSVSQKQVSFLESTITSPAGTDAKNSAFEQLFSSQPQQYLVPLVDSSLQLSQRWMDSAVDQAGHGSLFWKAS